MKKKKVVIDTNLWISFLISKNPVPIEFLLLSKKIDTLFSNILFEEFIAVASREKFQNYFPIEDILNLSHVLLKHSNFIEVISKINICRDEKDNFLLNLAIDGKADYLISGDKDLLILKKIKNT
jgi:putative PIN family toxin of toxin-antitoxin system